MCRVRENKDSSDLCLSSWVIEGDILMIWQNPKKNRSGPKGSGNQEISAQLSMCACSSAEALKPDSVARLGEMVCLESTFVQNLLFREQETFLGMGRVKK